MAKIPFGWMPIPSPAPHLKFMKNFHFSRNVFIAQSSRRSRERRRKSGLIDINQNGANDEHQNTKLHVSAVSGHKLSLTSDAFYSRLLVLKLISILINVIYFYCLRTNVPSKRTLWGCPQMMLQL